MRYQFQSGEQVHEIQIERHGEALEATIDGLQYSLEVLDDQPGQISLRIDGRPVIVYWVEDGPATWASTGGCAFRLEKPRPRRAHPPGDAEGSESARAPMPAQVRVVQVSEGDTVDKGQTLLLLEAMKMEIRIKAPSAGRVKKLLVQPGQQVEKDQPLVEIQNAPAD